MVTVQVSPQPANRIVAPEALGAGVDGLEEGEVAPAYRPASVNAMRSAGLGALTYRLRTELGVEAWHWNPQGVWSDTTNAQGYWTSQPETKAPITVCNGYRLPRRGSTIDQANNDGYSRLDDGDLRSFWKSNPYLDKHYTGEDNTRHPQWVVIDLGRMRPVNAVQIAWGTPYAVRYQAEYWQGDSSGDDAQSIDDTFGDGLWRPFPEGSVRQGAGGSVLLGLTRRAISARFVRLWMTQSSNTAPAGSNDIRDRLGYAIREIGLGTLNAQGRFHDWLRHAPDGRRQTPIYASSTDPWHRTSDRDRRIEQPGFDRVFGSGLTNGMPLLTPCGLLYDTPENAVAELRFLRARGYPVTRMELGEEPDGQYMVPEDYGALFLQWAAALHTVNPSLQLGGPSFQTAIYGWTAWPDLHGDRSWLHRFLRYLKTRGRMTDFAFFSFEWYPFDNVCSPPAPQLALETRLLANALASLEQEGLPRTIPWLITEYGYSAFAGQVEMDLPAALLNAEIAAQFLTLGGTAAYLYGYEPNVPIREAGGCETWGNLALLLSGRSGRPPQSLATYYAANLLTEQWVQPDTRHPQALYRAVSSLHNSLGLPLVTAYAVHRPDGQWAVLLINKDPKQTFRISVRFQLAGGKVELFAGSADLFQYSAAQYVWHPKRKQGYPSPDLPPIHHLISGAVLNLPPFSLSILRGRVIRASAS